MCDSNVIILLRLFSSSGKELQSTSELLIAVLFVFLRNRRHVPLLYFTPVMEYVVINLSYVEALKY